MDDKALSKQRSQIHEILEEAFALYRKRDAKYKGLWAQYGAEDNAHHLRSKAARTMRVIQNHIREGKGNDRVDEEKLVEDAFDAINYAAFVVCCVRNRQIESVESEGAKEAEPVGPAPFKPLTIWD